MTSRESLSIFMDETSLAWTRFRQGKISRNEWEVIRSPAWSAHLARIA